MIFTESPLPGACLVDMELLSDERGFFARAYCEDEFAAHDLGPPLRQCSVSYNGHKGTLRGLHYQSAPHEEHKLVRCTAGAIFDVIVDIRPQSRHYRQWFGTELSAQNRRALFIPGGFAHGFITLTDDTEAYYLVDEFYAPECERGIRWNDSRFSIPWPIEPVVISKKDQDIRDFDPTWHLSSG